MLACISTVEYIETLLTREVLACRLPDALPGFTASADGEGIEIAMYDMILPAIPKDDAMKLSEQPTHAATAMKVGHGVQGQFDNWTLAIGRHGRGVMKRDNDVTMSGMTVRMFG